MTPDEMKARTKRFALDTIRFCRTLPRTDEARVIGRQLVKAGTSVGANYRAVCRSRSDAEFIARLGVAVEESDESAYWLELLLEANIVTRVRMAALHAEAEALTRMFAKSRETVRRRLRRTRKSESKNQNQDRNQNHNQK